MITFHQVRRGPDASTVVLSGEMDLADSEELRSVLAAAVAGTSAVTAVDLHDVTFLDCSVIDELVRAHAAARREGRTLTVTRPQGIVRKVLELTGVLAILADPAGRKANDGSGNMMGAAASGPARRESLDQPDKYHVSTLQQPESSRAGSASVTHFV